MLLPQVFYPGTECPVFFVANRGHHADIGGITPGRVYEIIILCVLCLLLRCANTGSMPSHSTYLWEEGMCVKSFKLVVNGIFQEEGQKIVFVAVLFTHHDLTIAVRCVWSFSLIYMLYVHVQSKGYYHSYGVLVYCH